MFKKINKKVNEKKKINKNIKESSQPRMRLDLPPGGFLRPPVAALAPPDGAGGCDVSFCSGSSCSASTSSGLSTDAATIIRNHTGIKITESDHRLLIGLQQI